MTYLSVCSGIEAASVAWEPLGFKPVGFAEIEPFPCEVLRQKYPAVKNYGDITQYEKWNGIGQFDVLVGGGSETIIKEGQKVRRLTPLECERLQGFPDNWTRIEWRGKPAEQCPDSHRYKAIGNSMAVPVMRWIGERIEKINKEVNK